VLVVAALRKPCRRLFGTERAFQLWLLPPLAVLASQLPHAAESPVVVLSPVLIAITSVVTAVPGSVDRSNAVDWHVLAAVAWMVGSACSLGLAVLVQQRYRRRMRGAAAMPGSSSRWPVLRAVGTDVGPALVGAWRMRIVLPADFEQRYDAGERTLILAHEIAHARRLDGWWCLFARLAVALVWFHPLAWWALAAFRHDQELACDAAVLREHGAHRRSYANAMLKTQSSAFALPVGCTWSPRHPFTERIAMLKQPSPNRRRQQAGAIAGFTLAILVGGSVYAASEPQTKHPGQAVPEAQYQLDMQVELSTDDGHKRRAETAALALCMLPGTAATAKVDNMTVEVTAAPVADQVHIDLAVGGIGAASPVHIQLRGALGQTLRATGKGVDGRQAYVIGVTPQAGCPAQVLAAASPIKVTEHITNGTTRAAAESIAAMAGWTLVNPDALGRGAVTLSFNDMPAGTALQRVADLAGVKVELEGKRVHFVPK
jgi:beta-lactamase regulating signal transducer with metallopeptidase domain